MSKQDDEFEAWFRSECERTEPSVTRIDVRHCREGGSDRLWCAALEHSTSPEETERYVKMFSSGVLNKVYADGESWPAGFQRYIVVSLNGREELATFSLRVRGQDQVGSYADRSTETADGKGQLAQAMRLTEGFARLAVTHSERQIESLHAELAAQRQENARLRAEIDTAFESKLKYHDALEGLLDRSADREALWIRTEARIKRRDKMLGTVTRIAPRLLAAVPGGEEFAKLAGQEAGFESLLTELASDPEKFEAMSEVIEGFPVSEKNKTFLRKSLNDASEKVLAERAKRKAMGAKK